MKKCAFWNLTWLPSPALLFVAHTKTQEELGRVRLFHFIFKNAVIAVLILYRSFEPENMFDSATNIWQNEWLIAPLFQYANAVVFSDDITICFNATIDKDNRLATGSRLVHATVLMDLLWNRATFGDGSYPATTDQSHNIDTLMDEFNFYVPGTLLSSSTGSKL